MVQSTCPPILVTAALPTLTWFDAVIAVLYPKAVEFSKSTPVENALYPRAVLFLPVVFELRAL